MKKIAIDTVYGEFNYGNKLQNYALIKIYEKMGFSATTLQVYQSALIQKPIVKIKKKIKKVLNILPINSWRRNVIKRENNFARFSRSYLHLSKRYNTHTFDYRVLNDYDVISVGSDQVWNDADFDENDVKYYSLYNVTGPKKISFAASIGKDQFQEKYKNIFQEALSSYDCITCREEGGSLYLAKLLNRECSTFLDPTLFLNLDDWNSIAKKPEWLKSDGYDLMYFLGGKPDGFKKGDNYPEVDVLDKNGIAYTASPNEFVYLIKHAENVYTDSFHACVFSMIYKRNFYIYKRKNQLSDMSSRIVTLFNTFNIKKGYAEKIGTSDYEKFESIRKQLCSKELDLLHDQLVK